MNAIPSDSLELAVFLWKELQQRELQKRHILGIVSASLDFQGVQLALEDAKLFCSSDENERRVEFRLPATFYSNLEELIENPEWRTHSPSKFFIADFDYLHSGQAISKPESVEQYLLATQFYSLLAELADHQGGNGAVKTLIFLQNEKLEITPDYTVSDFCEMSKVEKFKTDFISTETHKEQKRTIVRTVLLEMFKGRARVTFAELLKQFSDFIERLSASYELYVAEFSFQKVKAEVEKEKLDATIKLNKVFSDIQNQLLAIPAALVLVAGQMSDTEGWAIKNLLIWLGSFIFSCFMTLLVRNQRHTLIAVKQEIDQQWQQIKSKHTSIADRFNSSYKELEKRYAHQEQLIRVVDFLVAMSLTASTAILLWYSVPDMRNWFLLVCFSILGSASN